MNTAKQNLGEYVYKASNLAVIAGGLLAGHGLGQVMSRGDVGDWIELATGIIVASGSLIYRLKNADRYDPEIRRIKDEISRNESMIRRLENEISANQKIIRETEQEILRNYERTGLLN